MRKIVLFSIILPFMMGCEEVIDVDVPEGETRLIVNGILRVDETREFVPVEIKVTESSIFFEDNPIASIESAVIFYGTPNPDAPEILEDMGVSNLSEFEPGSGLWVPDPTFDADQRIRVSNIKEGDVFILILGYNDRRYAASTTYVKSVPIDTIEQGNGTLFGADETEIIVTFTDTRDTQDYYVIDFGFNEFLAVEDEFVDGQAFEFSYFYGQEFEQGKELTISLLGADQNFFNYMDLIIEQTQDTGGVFQTPIATVRGNIFDVTGLDNDEIFDNVERPNNFALGYFAIVEEYQKTLIIE
jgi:hypothetical protein